MLQLPFTRDDFLGVFAAYNTALWPVAVALWLASLVALVVLLRGRRLHRAMSALLAVHWAWSAIAYHLVFFARINPAAYLFAGLFLVQATIFCAVALSRRPVAYSWGRSPRHVIGLVLAGYGLLYPFLAVVAVHSYPRVPTFGVPCPTVLFTAGVLLLASPMPWSLIVVPALWSVIGGSAAVLLGVVPDFMLFVAGLSLVVCAARRA